jgi:hypothetical protein
VKAFGQHVDQEPADELVRVERRRLVPATGSTQSPKTYSTVAWRWSLSSGVLTSLALAEALGPDAIAIYCLSPTPQV